MKYLKTKACRENIKTIDVLVLQGAKGNNKKDHGSYLLVYYVNHTR